MAPLEITGVQKSSLQGTVPFGNCIYFPFTARLKVEGWTSNLSEREAIVMGRRFPVELKKASCSFKISPAMESRVFLRCSIQEKINCMRASFFSKYARSSGSAAVGSIFK